MSFWQIYEFVKNSNVFPFGFLLATHNLGNSSNRVFSQLGNSSNSVKDKGLTNDIMYVERKVFSKVKINFKATKYHISVVQQV